MKPSRVLIGLVILAVLGGCGGGGSTATSTSTSPASPSPSQSSCQADTDSVRPNVQPLIEISPTGAATPTTVTTRARLTCYTTLRVTQGGSATATFGTVTQCVISQISPSSGVGTLVSRYPMHMLFSLVEGMVTCASGTAQGLEAQVCGQGTVHITTNSTSWDASCAADGTFWIAVLRGSVQVDYRSGHFVLNPLSRLVVTPSTGPKVHTGISFPPAELSLFDSLKP